MIKEYAKIEDLISAILEHKIKEVGVVKTIGYNITTEGYPTTIIDVIVTAPRPDGMVLQLGRQIGVALSMFKQNTAEHIKKADELMEKFKKQIEDGTADMNVQVEMVQFKEG